MNSLLRSIPKVDVFLEDTKIIELIKKYNYNDVINAIRNQIEEVRANIINSSLNDKTDIKNLIVESTISIVKHKNSFKLKKVINATGVIVHTNLGRSRLSEQVMNHVKDVAQSYSNLEYDLISASRGDRHSHIEELISDITGAESAVVVNNNAAAVLLVLDTFGSGKEVIVSRGELVEIGGSFRIPDVMHKSGATLIEVGTTNKTHEQDYINAITEQTSAFLKVHTSNYKILGFTKSVSNAELVQIAKEKNIMVIEDIGSGTFVDFSKYNISHEPTVMDSIKDGVDIVTFSGDKLLGGPQCGIIVGNKKYIDIIKRNQLLRALRVDKLIISALEATLLEYKNMDLDKLNIPTISYITMSIENINQKNNILSNHIKNDAFEIVPFNSTSQIGGGSLPTELIPSIAIKLIHKNKSCLDIERIMRSFETPIIGRIEKDTFIIDLRCCTTDEIAYIASCINSIKAVN